MNASRQFRSVRVVLRDKDRNPLALTDHPDASQIHDVDSLQGARDLARSTTHGWMHDDGGEVQKKKVAHVTINDGGAVDHLPIDHPFFR